MLKAPSFACVYEWRTKQEEKLQYRLESSQQQNAVMNTKQLQRFIEHYQRLTEHMLDTLPEQADIVFMLDTHHNVTKRV